MTSRPGSGGLPSQRGGGDSARAHETLDVAYPPWDLYYEDLGSGVPILLIPPAGATASTWSAVVDELARIGRVVTYDRRGYARSGGEPVRSIAAHTADAAALLEHLRAPRAVVVGTSAGAAIAVDLAVRRPELVRAVVAHEFPWRFTRHLPDVSQVTAIVKIGALALRGRHGDAAEILLRSAYTYRDGGSAWDAFPDAWRRIGRENARAALADFRNSVAGYPSSTVRRRSRRRQLRRAQPRQYGAARSSARRGTGAAHRRSGPRSPLRCNGELRAADRRFDRTGRAFRSGKHGALGVAARARRSEVSRLRFLAVAEDKRHYPDAEGPVPDDRASSLSLTPLARRPSCRAASTNTTTSITAKAMKRESVRLTFSSGSTRARKRPRTMRPITRLVLIIPVSMRPQEAFRP
jgi:pimeloyl-ACP methyl ester carboxylesterase